MLAPSGFPPPAAFAGSAGGRSGAPSHPCGSRSRGRLQGKRNCPRVGGGKCWRSRRCRHERLLSGDHLCAVATFPQVFACDLIDLFEFFDVPLKDGLRHSAVVREHFREEHEDSPRVPIFADEEVPAVTKEVEHGPVLNQTERDGF